MVEQLSYHIKFFVWSFWWFSYVFKALSNKNDGLTNKNIQTRHKDGRSLIKMASQQFSYQLSTNRKEDDKKPLKSSEHIQF